MNQLHPLTVAALEDVVRRAGESMRQLGESCLRATEGVFRFNLHLEFLDEVWFRKMLRRCCKPRPRRIRPRNYRARSKKP